MSNKAKSGLYAEVNIPSYGTLVDTALEELNPIAWYEVNTIAAATGLPSYVVEGTVFMTPIATATPIAIVDGDSAYPLTFDKLCKVNFSIDSEYGVIDVTTDCSNGRLSNIIDGLNGASGTLSGFLTYNKATGEMEDASAALVNRFFDKVTDDGEGVYVYTAKANEQVVLQVVLNSDDTAQGDVQNILLIPAYLTGISSSGDVKGVQSRDINWTSGEGPAYIYQRTIPVVA